MRLRKFPYPYRAMLAISTDIDRTTIQAFRNIHRFLNTRSQTSMGPGLGLDVADSMWVFNAGPRSPDVALFSLGAEGKPRPEADELTAYAQVGWIDTLHTYGNFTSASGEPVFERRHAERAIAELERREIQLPVWANHGSAVNTQNIGHRPRWQGDLPGSRGYHADLMCSYGVRYAWQPSAGAFAGTEEPLARFDLRDGRRIWGFERYTCSVGADAVATLRRNEQFFRRNAPRLLDAEQPVAMLWWPELLDDQLAPDRLDEIVDGSRFCIAAQHLGRLGGSVDLPDPAVTAFRRLREAHDAGRILVARTSRLLEYARVSSHLEFTVKRGAGHIHIDISAVRDPVLGTFVPTLQQLRGITFEVQGDVPVALFINGRHVPGRELQRSDADPPAVGIRWFAEDATDHAEPWDRDRAVRTPSTGTSRDSTRTAQHPRENVYRWEEMVERLGFIGRARVLDVGSGRGEAAVALARRNGHVQAVEPRTDFILAATQLATECGVAERVSFQRASAEDAVLPEGLIELMVCSAVLMFCDHERVLSNLFRWGEADALLYCTYTLPEGRLGGAVHGLLHGNAGVARSQLGHIVSDGLFRSGVGRPRGGRIRACTREELLAVLGELGFEPIAFPELQAGQGMFLGKPRTFDVLARRIADTPAATGESATARAERLLGLGLPRAALAALGPDRAADLPETALLRLRAATLAGQVLPVDPTMHVRLTPADRHLAAALADHTAGRLERALAGYGTLPAAHPDRAFLLGSCLLALGRGDEVAAQRAPAPGSVRDPVAVWAVRTLGALSAQEPVAGVERVEELLEHLMATNRAPLAEIERLRSALPRAQRV